MWSPLSNDALSPATWRPEPDGRGHYSILATCFITLSLCIWSALHLNIPEHNKSGSQKWRKLKWLVIGLVAPEFVGDNLGSTSWEVNLADSLSCRLPSSHLVKCLGKIPISKT